ncbi:MAG: multiheme c-type cytochrome [Candidatus Palauibacterales bacterium]|nr:multiheme c-type cytochrome [Candidatus Palauibacterales bacterium]
MSERLAHAVFRARPSPAGLCLASCALVALAACAESESDSTRLAVADPATLPVDQRTFSDLTDFVQGYWRTPIPLQGPAPEGFNPLEASFEPSTCGTCHPKQYEDWQTTIHSAAYSPGLAGQLVNWERDSYANVRVCLACHTPLSEQSAQVPDTAGQLVGNPYFDRSLRDQGMVCAGCHFRAWRKYGPPRRDGSLEPSPEGSPHGGVTRTPFFEDSRFCKGCHQFQQPAANGKPLENTYEEWRNSKYPVLEMQCQNCHMPDRRHLWRGIHDSTMVAGGVTIELVQARAGEPVTLRVTNSGTGHRFPTYVTPEVRVRIDFLDADWQPLPGGNVVLIARKVAAGAGGWQELSDTRLPPDSTATLTAEPGPDARYARGRVIVLPSNFYEAVFEGMLSGALSDTSRALIAQAHRRASSSAYSIFDDTLRIR